ncbi:MAG: thioesterase family protein [Spirochaetes bacterium]|nr:thioesterase family protein [Spirochaetota bacterium]
MGRIKLEQLNNYRFSHEQRICMSNINQAMHVGASQMVEILHDGRYQMLKKLELNELNLGDGKTGAVVSDLAVNYKAEIFLDETITVETDIGEIEEKGFRIFYRISKNGKTAALAETGHVCFNFLDKKICTVPEVLIKKLQ